MRWLLAFILTNLSSHQSQCQRSVVTLGPYFDAPHCSVVVSSNRMYAFLHVSVLRQAKVNGVLQDRSNADTIGHVVLSACCKYMQLPLLAGLQQRPALMQCMRPLCNIDRQRLSYVCHSSWYPSESKGLQSPHPTQFSHAWSPFEIVSNSSACVSSPAVYARYIC